MQREILLINDIHLGVQRSGGTTPASAEALRTKLRSNLRALLYEHLDKDVIINGDLFDAFNVSMLELLEFYLLVVDWMEASKDGYMAIGRGNHDVSKDSSKLSSFDVVGALLSSRFGDRIRVVKEPEMVHDGIYMVPHAPNQDTFDHQLGNIPAKAAVVLVHANFDNRFAVERDHSLNVSREQAWGIIRGPGQTPMRLLVFGHEHQGKLDMDSHLIVTGNQWPTSVADCQGNPNGMKSAHILRPLGERYALDPITTWTTTNSYRPVPWQDLALMGADDYGEFIRVGGRATAAEAPQVIAAIANFRQKHDAFVVSNAVKIEGTEIQETVSSAEELQAFNVLKYLLEHLNPEQGAEVQNLLDTHGDRQ